MAQRQYSFDFIMNAVLNGGFSATFSKAQQEFVRLGNEIRNLQSIQRDVKAYEKQSAAVQNTTAKLENLKRQYELVKKQITETTGSTTALEREKLKLEQRIANTSNALEKQQERLDGTKERLDAAGVSTDDLSTKDAELTKKIQELTEEQKRAAEGAGEFKDKAVEAVEAVGSAITAAGIATAVKEIAEAYEECVGVSADFGKAMSAVEAISEANRSEMAALKAEAKELGATTIHTAQQSAKGMEYMVMAGWDAQETLSGIKGTTTLAAAAGEDLAQVSDIVTDSLSGFNLRASDTAHFVDVLAATAANSNTKIAIMGETFKNSSSVAGALSYSIEDVAVMVGLMANNAVKGTRAGTALRNIFNGLLDGVTLTGAAFGEAEYSAINYDGSMKGLMETVEDLRGYFSQMTEAERVNNAMAIAGMRGYNGLLAILNASDEQFQSLYESIYNCSGAAERMAAVKLDNLAGDITLMNSATEALQTTIGEQFNPELRELTQLGTELINGVNSFAQENPSLVKGIMAGAGAFAAMGTAIVGVNAAIKVFKALELATLFTGPAGVLLGVAAGIAGVTAVTVAMVDAMRDGGPAVRELTEAAREANAAMAESKAVYEDTAASALASANVANLYIDKLEEMGDAASLSGEKQKEYQNTLALLLQVMPSLSDCISQTTDEYGRVTYALETSTDALRVNTEEWKKNAQAQAYQEYLNGLMEQYNGVLLEQAENEIGLTKARYELEAATRKYDAAQERMTELWDEASEEAKRQYQEYGKLSDASDYLTQEYYDLEKQLNDLSQEMADSQAAVDDHKKAIENDAEAVADLEEEMSWAEKAWKNLLKALGLYTDEQEELTAGEQEVQEVLDGTFDKMQALAEEYTEVYEAAKKSFDGQFGLFDVAQADADATVANAQAALNSQLSYWQDYAANVAVLRQYSADDLHLTQENYDALMEYVRTGTPEAAGLAADMVKAINDGNTEALTNLGETIGQISELQEQAAQNVAEWTTGLLEQTEQLTRDMEAEIKNLDMSPQAGAYGRATIQAFINSADSMIGQVRAAYARVAAAASAALSTTGVGSMSISGGAWESARSVTLGFAAGTDNAPPGWSWVGENGPELMRFSGGEQVIPAEASRQLAEDYAAYSRYTTSQGEQRTPPLEVIDTGTTASTKVEMHFHIESGALPETVDAWQEYARRGELKATILEVMEEADADMRRRAMR